jgi:hypothetical protein
MDDTKTPTAPKKAPLRPRDPDEGQGHEQIETDDFDDQFSRDYWKTVQRPKPEK